MKGGELMAGGELVDAAVPDVPQSVAGAPRSARIPWIFRGGFGRLFLGQAVSAVGSQVTFLALPITAVFLLRATPGAMGLLGALDNLPYLLFGLGVGVLVDRRRRRPLMVWADLLRAVAVCSVPLGWALGILSFGQLCVVVFVVGSCNIVFDVAAQAQMPGLLPEDRVVDGNAALQTTTSLSTVVGPGISGQLIALFGAPVAIVVDAVSYVVSAVFIHSIREPEPVRHRSEGSARRQIAEGLRYVREDRRLVALAGAGSTISLAVNAAFAVFVYYLAVRAGWTAATIGLLYTAVGVAGAAGAILMPAVSRRIGLRRSLAGMPVLAGLGLAAIPVAVEGSLAPALTNLLLVTGSLAFGLGLVAFSVMSAGCRQTLAPTEARGRVLGTLRFFEWGSMPVGSLAGGALGQLFGAAVALEFAAIAFASAALWILTAPRFESATVTGEPSGA